RRHCPGGLGLRRPGGGGAAGLVVIRGAAAPGRRAAPALLEALPAVDGLSGRGLEGDLGLLAALRAHGGEQGPGRSTVRRGRRALPHPRRVPEPGGLVLEALLRVDRLLARREEELLPAVPTHQHLVLRFHGSHVSSEVRSERATAGRRGRPLTSLERAGG